MLAAVQSAIATYGVKKVTVVGHSLGGFINFQGITNSLENFAGGAIGLLDSVYLPLHITGVTFRGIFYGLPRVRPIYH